MKAEQSKFLSSISSTAEDGLTSSPDVSNSDDELDSEESVQHVCSLCHDPNSKAPVTFLILLQVYLLSRVCWHWIMADHTFFSQLFHM